MSNMLFSEFVDINPKVTISKGESASCVMMEELEPGRRYVYPRIKKPYKGGSKFENGDTLFARITPCLENGKIAQFISNDITPAFGSTEFIILRAKNGISDPGFVYYLSTTDTIRKPAEKSMFGVSGRQRADVKSIESLKLEFPEIIAQQRIASILSMYDDLIENNTRRIKILEEMAKLIYREWFVEFKALGVKLRKATTEEKKVTGKDQFPEGWEVGTIKNITKVIPGYAFNSNDWSDSGISVIKIKNILDDNSVNTVDTDYIPASIYNDKLKKYELNHKDMLIAMTGATAGKVGRIRTNSKLLLNQRVAKFECSKEWSSYLWITIRRFEEQSTFFKLADGAAQPNMSGSQIENVPILIPNEIAKTEYARTVDSLIGLTDNLFMKNQNLRRTRDLLLPKLVSGEIEV